MAIKVTVCAQVGHEIQSLLSKETQIPGTSSFVRQYELTCVKCGTSIEDIRKERIPSANPRVRKPKAAPQPVPNPVEVSQ